MSDKHESDEQRLPAELAAVERRLAELSPALLRIDRDRLMFEAGRAAAEAAFRVPVPSAERLGEGLAVTRFEPSPSSSLKGRGKVGIFWPAATATMTAATILLSVMLVRQGERRTMPGPMDVAQHRAATNAHETAPTTDRDARYVDTLPASRGAWPLDGRPMAGYLGQRYLALTQGVDTIANNWRQPAVGTGGDLSPSRPPTTRELLQEMLPNRS